MSVPWLAIFKAIPWGDVVGTAPKVLDQAKKLAATLRKTDGGSTTGAARPAPPHTPESPLPAIEARIASVEARIDGVTREALSSAEVIRSLAEQNAQLVQAVEILGARVRRLNWIVAVLVCVGVGGTVMWQLFLR